MTREDRIRAAIGAAARSLWPSSLEIIGLPALLRGLTGGNNNWNLRTFLGTVRHEFNKMENRGCRNVCSTP